MIATARAMIAASGRTWTAGQLAAWFATEYGVVLSPARVRIHLRRAGLSYHRTSRRLTHKQDPTAIATGPVHSMRPFSGKLALSHLAQPIVDEQQRHRP